MQLKFSTFSIFLAFVIQIPIFGNAAEQKTLLGTWKFAKVKDGPFPVRHEACAVMVNGLLVMIGGRGGIRPVTIYNPKSGTWFNRKGPQVEMHHMQCVVLGSSVWIPVSWNSPFPFEKNNNKVYRYNVSSDKWFSYKGLPPHRNRGSAAVVRRGWWIYVIAGNRGGHGAHAKALTWMDVFNIRTKKWLQQKFPNMPGRGRDHVGGALVKNKWICVAGGRDSGVQKFFNATITSTYCYSLARKKWIQRSDFPQGRAGAMTGTLCDGRMMIAGGEGHGKAFARVDVFNYFSWKRAPDLFDSRHGSGLAVSKCNGCNQIFIPTGAGGMGGGPKLTTIEQFVPKGGQKVCSKY